MKVGIVGSGPAGFYTARTLLKKFPGVEVDLLEMLPTPYGLVRYGVAPDHEDTRNVISEFDNVLSFPNCRFIGNVHVGRDVSLAELQSLYHAVVLSYGASADRDLGIPGEDLEGSFSARAFVNWYNGHPHYAGLKPDLQGGDTAVVVGNGNVAIDIARILLRSVDELRKTDLADYALEALAESKIRKVHIVGRRGPAQAAWTTAELREVTGMHGTRVVMRREELEMDAVDAQHVQATRALKRMVALLDQVQTKHEKADQDTSPLQRELNLRFLLSPTEIVESERKGHVGGMKMARNRLEGSADRRKAVPTGEEELLDCALVMRSVGYRSVPIEGLPFSTASHTVPHSAGGVLREGETVGGNRVAGLYVSGWLKRGPTGIIGSNIGDGQITATTIMQDWEDGNLDTKAKDGGAGLQALLKERGVMVVAKQGWKKIERIERERAESEGSGKPRRKLTSILSMLDAADAA
eukprot:CAMPEP_0177693960 /NCGR_PEP_ID=MMETSP0484_2-20121128/2679_1 /TAXON_ID=354590 /ORGANISM="Rhodomonas lens, Strain RHODO" /LENGTH=466 /DNA_ID=CAMNT_0019204807 /DNA_START=225 /DNA_END=1625 /DNA_ORIENTATION=-